MLNDLISGIRFLQTGEAYIINAEGTDIAVSDLSRLDWVTSQYNARKIIETAESLAGLALQYKTIYHIHKS